MIFRLATIVVASIGTSLAHANSTTAMPERGICAHRGASETHPENTLAAFREALMLGAQMLEFDVASTSDGHVVLMHDKTVDRTTDGTGKISQMSLQQVQELDAGSWKGKKFKGERVPTLHETLNTMPQNIWLNIHLKGDDQLAKTVAEIVVQSRRTHQCFLACDAASAAAAKSIDARIMICNMDRQENSQNYVDASIDSGAEFIQLLGGQVQPNHARRLRDASVRINYCCANEPGRIHELLEAGVQFPLVDKLADALKVSDKSGIERLTPVYRRESSERPAVAVFKDGETQVVKEFEDPSLWIHHDLWVETEFDSDGNGKLDRMHVSVTRQRQTDSEGLKVPVVYVSSPYFSGTASGDRNFFWDPRQEHGAQPPAHSEAPSIPQQTRRVVISKSHWNDWLPRGFAVVHSASPGTGLSQGCPTIGGDNESLAPKAVIDWLCGRATGYTTPKGSKTVEAFWCTGKVGMTGTSYNGTIPLAAATTGVEGLEAIIPIAPNTSYYHYYRSHGLVRHPGGYIGEDVDVLYNYINSGDPQMRDYCNAEVRDKEMASGFDRSNGDYNDFWAGRDYLNDLKPMNAALLMAHGFNDWNVMPEHSVRIYKAVQAMGRPVQCYFHQGGHGGAPPLKMMNRWFTRYLYGVQNGVENDPRAWVVREHKDRMQPTPYADYPHPEAAMTVLYPQNTGLLSPDRQSAQGEQSFADDFNVDGTTLVQSDSAQNRLLYVTPELTVPVHISGTCRISVRLSCSRPACNFSVWLVSLPWDTDAKAKIYENVITRGWADPQNHASLRSGEPLVPGEFYDLAFDLQPDDQVIAAGKKIGLMIFSTDRDHTLWSEPGTQVTIDLDQTALQVPVVGELRFSNSSSP